jgi:hypothetical protein
MRSSKALLIAAILACFAGASFAADTPAKAVAAPAILPEQFGGWQAQGAAQTSQDAAAADPTNADVLREYGFSDVASSTFTRDDGRTLKIRAARFADASDAFGAYTFYLQPNMTAEKIGDQGASMGQRVLFYRGHIVVDALFSKESPMSGGELRELAGVLPRPSGNAANLPSFIEFLPRRGYIANTQKYALGPKALSALAPPVPASLVDFSVSPEVLLGHYGTSSGEATLMLIYYPTPQLAAEHLRKIDAAHTGAQPQSGAAAVEDAGRFFDKRTGPIIAITAGPLSDSDAKSLLGLVNYEAKVTWNQRTLLDKNKDLGGLLVNIIILCFILGAMAVVAGVAFGGIRILMRRLYPDRVFDRREQMEFISLHLAETVAEGGAGGQGAGPVEQDQASSNPR